MLIKLICGERKWGPFEPSNRPDPSDTLCLPSEDGKATEEYRLVAGQGARVTTNPLGFPVQKHLIAEYTVELVNPPATKGKPGTGAKGKDAPDGAKK